MRLLAFFPGFFLVSLPFFTFDHVSFAQGQTIFFEDFEKGDQLPAGWTVTGVPEILWHIAEDGECIAQTRMGAYNRGDIGICGYDTEGPNTGELKSTVFTLTGQPPYTLSFRYMRLVDPNGESTCVFLVNADEPGAVALGCVTDNSGDPMDAVAEIPDSPQWEGRNVRIEFEFTADQFGNNNPGWFIDNVEVRNSSAPPIPAASQWGLAVMALLFVTGGTIVYRRRHPRGEQLGRRRVEEA